MLAEVAPEAQAALATAAGAVLVALVGTAQSWAGRRESKRAAATVEKVADRVGNPNGQGDLVAMVSDVRASITTLQQGMSTVVAGQAGQDNRIARLEAGQHELTTRLAAVEARTASCPGSSTPTPPTQES